MTPASHPLTPRGGGSFLARPSQVRTDRRHFTYTRPLSAWFTCRWLSGSGVRRSVSNALACRVHGET